MTDDEKVEAAREYFKGHTHYPECAHTGCMTQAEVLLSNLLSVLDKRKGEPVVRLKEDNVNGGYHVTDQHNEIDSHAFGGLEGLYQRIPQEGE